MTELSADALMRPLPPGRHGIAPDQVAKSQRARLLWAIVKQVGEKSYASTTIADITGAADVSKKTFYKFFRDKEQCFLDAYNAFADLVLRVISTPFEQSQAKPKHWLDWYRASTEAYLQVMSAQPIRTRALMLEVLSAGPRILDTRRDIMKAFADNLEQVHAVARQQDPTVRELEPTTFQLAIGGLDECIRQYIHEDRCRDLPELADTVVGHIEVLFVGR